MKIIILAMLTNLLACSSSNFSDGDRRSNTAEDSGTSESNQSHLNNTQTIVQENEDLQHTINSFEDQAESYSGEEFSQIEQMSSDEPGLIVEEETVEIHGFESDQSVNEPVQVGGAFLICQPISQKDDRVDVGCSITDQSKKKKYFKETPRFHLVSEGKALKSKRLPQGSPWNWQVSVPAKYQNDAFAIESGWLPENAPSSTVAIKPLFSAKSLRLKLLERDDAKVLQTQDNRCLTLSEEDLPQWDANGDDKVQDRINDVLSGRRITLSDCQDSDDQQRIRAHDRHEETKEIKFLEDDHCLDVPLDIFQAGTPLIGFKNCTSRGNQQFISKASGKDGWFTLQVSQEAQGGQSLCLGETIVKFSEAKKAVALVTCD